MLSLASECKNTDKRSILPLIMIFHLSLRKVKNQGRFDKNKREHALSTCMTDCKGAAREGLWGLKPPIKYTSVPLCLVPPVEASAYCSC